MDSRVFRWDPDKSKLLKRERGIGFEDIVEALNDGRLLADTPHPKPEYAHQRLLVVDIQGYAVIVPYVVEEGGLFLKTLYPSRKVTKRFQPNRGPKA